MCFFRRHCDERVPCERPGQRRMIFSAMCWIKRGHWLEDDFILVFSSQRWLGAAYLHSCEVVTFDNTTMRNARFTLC